MKLKRILIAAVLGTASIHVPQSAWSQETQRWFVVKDATDLTYAFEFVCVGDRTAAQDTVAGLRILDSDSSVHALPERAFRANQAAELIGSADKELSCDGETGSYREVNQSGEEIGPFEGFDIRSADPVIRLPVLDTLTQEQAVATPAQMVRSRPQPSVTRRSSRPSISVNKPNYRLVAVLLAAVASRRP